MPLAPIRPDTAKFFEFLKKPIDKFNSLVALLKNQGFLGLALEIAATSRLSSHGVKLPPTFLLHRVTSPLLINEPRVNDNSSFTFGGFLIRMAWQAGLSPRFYDRTNEPNLPDGKDSLFVFVRSAQPDFGMPPVSLEVLQNSTRLKSLSTPAPSQPRGLPLREWLSKLKDSYGITARSERALLDQPLVLDFPEPVSFAYVLDAIATDLDVAWDWSDDAAVIRSRDTRCGCDDRLASR